MQLTPLLKLRAYLGDSITIGKVPIGTRSIGVVTGGTFEGERLKGTVLTPGADWVLFDERRIGRIDVRLILKTDDGANIYMQYFGVLQLNTAMQTAFAEGTETQFGDNYFMTQPRFETGDERYSWLNDVVAVAEGRAIAGGVEYLVYACDAGAKLH
jgi:hypothetical protein